MSVQQAFLFIQKVRNDDTLKAVIRALDDKDNLCGVVAMGLKCNFEFTEEELRIAFKQDWILRNLQTTKRT